MAGPKAASLVGGATATITAKEYGFEFKGLKAGKNVVLVVNAAKELHHFLMFPILAGKTLDDVKKAFTSEGPPTGPPPVDFTKGAGSAVIEKSEGSLVTEINLVPGRYAVLCFMSDRVGGPPHVAKGMLTELSDQVDPACARHVARCRRLGRTPVGARGWSAPRCRKSDLANRTTRRLTTQALPVCFGVPSAI